MKNTWIATLFFLSLPLFSEIAHAQALSVEDCIHIALQKNARLVSAGYAVEAAEQRVKEIGTLRKPAANLRVGSGYAPVTGLDPALTEGGEYAGLVEIRQPLYDGGSISLTRKQAETNLQQSANTRIRTSADIRLEVRLAYIDLVRAQRQYRLTQESIKDLEFYLETVRSLANGGAVPKTDIMKVEIQLQSEMIVLNDLRTSIATATKRLLEPLGLPLDSTIAVQDSVTLPAIPERFMDNPEIKEFGLSIESARLDVQLTQTDRSAVVSLFGSAGGWTSRNQLLESPPHHIFGYQVGISLDLPLWDWGAITARIEQKNAVLNALRADLEVLHRRLDIEYQTNSEQLGAAMEKVNLLAATHAKAQEQFDLLRAQYAGGSTSSLEVLDARRALFGTVLQEQQTRADIDALRAQMLRLTGEPE